MLSCVYPTPAEMVVNRDRQILQLARHARQSIDALERWRVAKIRHWHALLVEQLEAESTWARVTEAT